MSSLLAISAALSLFAGAPSASAQEVPPTFVLEPAFAPALSGEAALGGTLARSPDQWFRQNGKLTVRNVPRATLTPVLPKAGATGAGVIVAPGGGFLSLAMDTEGLAVANWLAERGIAAFVLKYRTLPTTPSLPAFADQFNRAVRGLATNLPRPSDTPAEALADGKAAIRHVRENAGRYGVEPRRLGFMGFSAGGMLARSLGAPGGSDGPAFVAAIYPRMDAVTVGATAPPLFALLAADDPVIPVRFDLIESWRAAKRPTEFHLIASGGHGFGVGLPGTSADGWLDDFVRWLGVNGIVKGK